MHARHTEKTRLFWGWYIVAGAFLLMALNYGARYSFGIFVQPLTADNGWSRSVVSLAASINLLVYAFGGISSGRLLDRVAPRWIVTAGAVVSAAGSCSAPAPRPPWIFFSPTGCSTGWARRGRAQSR